MWGIACHMRSQVPYLWFREWSYSLVGSSIPHEHFVKYLVDGDKHDSFIYCGVVLLVISIDSSSG